MASVVLAVSAALAAPAAAGAAAGTVPAPVLDEGFNGVARAGTVATVYKKALWTGAAFGNAHGMYSDTHLSVHDGKLDVTLSHDVGGYVAFDPTGKGQTYGRYRVSFKVTGSGRGYGAALLLWPKSDKGTDGELDLMEGLLSTTVKVFHHTMKCESQRSANPGYCGNQNWVTTKTRFTDKRWHHIDVTWSRTSVVYKLDDKTVLVVTKSVPKTPHALILQIAQEGRHSKKVSHFLVGSVQIDPI